MCMHNAKRDDYILKPFKVEKEAKYWNPLTGQLQTSDDFLKDENNLRAYQIKGTLKEKMAVNTATISNTLFEPMTLVPPGTVGGPLNIEMSRGDGVRDFLDNNGGGHLAGREHAMVERQWRADHTGEIGRDPAGETQLAGSHMTAISYCFAYV